MTDRAWAPIILGHRGARGLAPENTLPSFQVAADLGLPAAELDVHLTSDGHLVVIHDHTVDRTTDGTGRVDRMPFERLRTLNAAAHWSEYPATPIPTLGEVFERFGTRFRWEIELKVDDETDVPPLVTTTADTIRAHGIVDRVLVTSFSADALEVVRRTEPDFRRGLITGSDPEGALERAIELGCVQLAVNQSVLTPEVADRIRSAGLALTGWQGNTPQELERLHAARVDAFSSDRPDVALEWLAGQGLTPVLAGGRNR